MVSSLCIEKYNAFRRNNMKIKFTALALSAAMALSLAACGQSASQSQSAAPASGSQSQPQSQSASAPAAVEETMPVTLTDAAGRQVTIETEPETLVSGYYITTSMLIALGQQDKLVGIEAKADTRPIYALAAPELLELPSVGTAKEFDLEGCAALEPDLVILPLKLQESAEALEQLCINALVVNPEDMDLLEETLGLLGQATGSSERAHALMDYNAETEAEMAELLADAEKPSVYLAGNSSYLSTAGSKMYQNTLIELGGGENVAAELEDDYWADISYEQLLAWNPDVIVIAADADYTKEDLLADSQLAGLTAVQNGAVYALPSSFEAWDSPVPSGVLGIRWMASALHGDLYSLEQFRQDAADFYKEFYGVEIDTQLITQ